MLSSNLNNKLCNNKAFPNKKIPFRPNSKLLRMFFKTLSLAMLKKKNLLRN